VMFGWSPLKCRDCPKLDICKSTRVTSTDVICPFVGGIEGNFYFLGHHTFIPVLDWDFKNIKMVSIINEYGLQLTGLPSYLSSVGSFIDEEKYYTIMSIFQEFFNKKLQREHKKSRRKNGRSIST